MKYLFKNKNIKSRYILKLALPKITVSITINHQSYY